jgi:hypothetical protein
LGLDQLVDLAEACWPGGPGWEEPFTVEGLRRGRNLVRVRAMDYSMKPVSFTFVVDAGSEASAAAAGVAAAGGELDEDASPARDKEAP